MQVEVAGGFEGFEALQENPSVGQLGGVPHVGGEGVVIPLVASAVGVVHVDGPFFAFGLELALEPQGDVAVGGLAVAFGPLDGRQFGRSRGVLVGGGVLLGALVLVESDRKVGGPHLVEGQVDAQTAVEPAAQVGAVGPVLLGVGGVGKEKVALHGSARKAAALVPREVGEHADLAHGHRNAGGGVVLGVGSDPDDHVAVERKLAVFLGHDVDHAARALRVELGSGVGDDLDALHASGGEAVKGVGAAEAQQRGGAPVDEHRNVFVAAQLHVAVHVERNVGHLAQNVGSRSALHVEVLGDVVDLAVHSEQRPRRLGFDFGLLELGGAGDGLHDAELNGRSAGLNGAHQRLVAERTGHQAVAAVGHAQLKLALGVGHRLGNRPLGPHDAHRRVGNRLFSVHHLADNQGLREQRARGEGQAEGEGAEHVHQTVAWVKGLVGGGVRGALTAKIRPKSDARRFERHSSPPPCAGCRTQSKGE